MRLGALLTLGVVGVALILLFLGPDVRSLIDTLLLALALAPPIIRQSPRAFLALARLKYWLLNTSSTWELEARFAVVGSGMDLRSLSRSLVANQAKGSRTLLEADDRCIFQLTRRFTVELTRPRWEEVVPDCAAGDEELIVSISPTTVGYRDSRHFLEGELLPLLELLRKNLQTPKELFSLTILLAGDNPFFGLYVQLVGCKAVEEFRLQFVLPAPHGDGRVTVDKEQMTVVSSTIEGLRKAASSALAFRVPAGGICR